MWINFENLNQKSPIITISALFLITALLAALNRQPLFKSAVFIIKRREVNPYEVASLTPTFAPTFTISL